MSAWLSGPVAGPLVDGDLCEANAGYVCGEPAQVLAQNTHGSEVPLCAYHAERHGIFATCLLTSAVSSTSRQANERSETHV
jgi:hypothetical protein